MDASGTIDFFEFLQLLRLVMEHEAKCARAREMALRELTEFTPYQAPAPGEGTLRARRALFSGGVVVYRVFRCGLGSFSSFHCVSCT